MPSRSQIISFIADMIEEVTIGNRTAASIAPDDRLIDDLGLDSLDYATVLLSCEQWLRVKVQEDGVDWASLATVDALAAFLEEQISEAEQ